VHTAEDIWARKRGSSDQLAALFVSMARAAGMKAYLMAVTNRDRRIFFPATLALASLTDDIAIVNVDGKEQFFDPGSRFCPYQHLAGSTAWPVASARRMGARRLLELRLSSTPRRGSSALPTSRWMSMVALRGRHHDVHRSSRSHVAASSLSGDSTSLERELRVSRRTPPALWHERQGGSIERLEAMKARSLLSSTSKGVVGSSTGKRLLITGDIFDQRQAELPARENVRSLSTFNIPHGGRMRFGFKLPGASR